MWLAASDKKPNGVTDRSWLWWEQGTRPVPGQVIDRIRLLVSWRNELIDFACRRKKIDLVWYSSLEDWEMQNFPPIIYRPYLSAIASIAALRPQLAISVHGQDSHACGDQFAIDAVALWLKYDKSLSGGRQQASE